MYKNFTLTESEKEQILKQHKSHGYKKPLNEDIEDEMGNDMPATNNGELKIDKYIFAPINVLMVQLAASEDEDPITVKIITNGGDIEEATYEVASYLEDGDDPERYISIVRQAVENGLLNGTPDGVLINSETKEIEG
jgi:hypothetical protein